MLNENLVKARKERGLTQEALAVKLNVVRQTVSKWEKGTAVPDADTLCRIADALEVSVSVLLGDTATQESTDTASIATSLAQINEQLAIRNRRAANVWKAVCLIALIVIGILIGKIYFGNGMGAAAVLPDKIEVSNVSFSCGSGELVCSFVPSVGSDDIVYTVTLYSRDERFESATASARYENGVCTVSFDRSELSEYAEYSAALTIECGADVRNLTLAKNVNFRDNGCTWESQWD